METTRRDAAARPAFEPVIPKPDAVAEPDWEVALEESGLPTIRFRGSAVAEAHYVFWGPKWKWLGVRASKGKRRGKETPFNGEVRGLGLGFEGTIRNDPPGTFTYAYVLDASKEQRGIIGGGIEFNLRPGEPVFEAKPGETELLPSPGRGWKWPVAEGQDVTVSFDPPLPSLYFERGNRAKIRAMFVGTDLAAGKTTVTMKVTLPAGARLVTPAGDRYAEEDDKRWYRDAMLWNRSPVDLSFLNHKPAGKYGFVKAKGGDLVFENRQGDATPVRFWGGNLAAYALFRPKEEIEEQAARIAALGFNLMRIHHHDSMGWVSPTVIDKKRGDSRNLDKAGIDGVDYWVKCLKDRGVYVWLDLHVGRHVKPGDVDTELGRIEVAKEVFKKSKPGGKGGPSGEVKGFCYYDAAIQKLMLEFQEKYLAHVNPYTGLAYKDDPAVMGLLVTNENDLTHHFGNLALPDKGNPVLNRMFNDSRKAFCERTGMEFEDTFKTWEPGGAKLFLNDREHAFNRLMLDGLAKLGVKVPVATTNYWGNEALWSLPALTAGGIIDVHSYEGAEFLGRNPRYRANVVSWIAAGQVHGKPLSVSEWNIVKRRPEVDRFCGPLYVASVGALQGWDAPMVYNYSQRGFGRPDRLYTWSSFCDPATTGAMPAAAVAFRQGHVSRARKTYCLKLDRRKLYYTELKPTNCRAIRTLAEQSRLTIGLPDVPELDWDEEARPAADVTVVTDPGRDFIPQGQSWVASDTGELMRSWEGGLGYQTVNTARTQAAQGWIGGREIALNHVTIRIETPKAVVAVTSLDDEPIARSRRLLVTALARARFDRKMNAFLTEPVTGTLAIEAPAGLVLHALGADGAKRPGPATTREGGRYAIALTGDARTHWFMLER